MFYHARIEFPGQRYGDLVLNVSRTQMEHEIAIPFIMGQITKIPFCDGTRVVNMRAALSLTLYCSETQNKAADFFAEHQPKHRECTDEVLEVMRANLASQNIKSMLERTFRTRKNQAFIVMKYGDEALNSTYELAVRPAFEEFKIAPLRVDTIEDSGKITDQILDEISSSKVVFADLTGARPNCYYETGFAHALGIDLILSIQSNEAPHFDLMGNRFIQWSNALELRKKLLGRLSAMYPQIAQTQ